MNSRTLVLFVEGPEDERFIRRVIAPYFVEQKQFPRIYAYSTKSQKEVKKYLKNIISHPEVFDFIFFCDVDDLNQCISVKKEKVLQKYDVPVSKIIVVVREIEGWYMAGLDDETLRTVGIAGYKAGNTRNLTKEHFISFMPKRYDYETDYRGEVLNHFSLETAISRNDSFNYFIRKHFPELIPS